MSTNRIFRKLLPWDREDEGAVKAVQKLRRILFSPKEEQERVDHQENIEELGILQVLYRLNEVTDVFFKQVKIL
jgi:hypothetical protein